MSSKPSVLIFGGLNTCSRALAAYLVPLDGEPLVSYLRIIDKYSVHPATTYIGAEFPKILESPIVEYRQVNLTVAEKVSPTFDPPEGVPPFDFVFDFTGEVWQERSEEILINFTCNVAKHVAEEAARRNVKAYVRAHQPYYETPSKGTHGEGEEAKPWGPIGAWWHETLRVLGAVENLNLVVLKLGFVYGPYTNYGVIASGIIVAGIYGWMKKPMKSMWSPGKNPTYTVHVEDVAGAAWAVANWVAPLGRGKAIELAGEEISSHMDKNALKKLSVAPPHGQKVVVPIINVVDDANSTLLSVGQLVTSYFGTTFEFFNFVESTLMKIQDDHVDEVNDLHVTKWAEMTTKSDPPTTNQFLSAYMDKFQLDKHCVALSNTRLKNLIGYQLRKPQFTREAIAEVVEKWKAEGSWPIV